MPATVSAKFQETERGLGKASIAQMERLWKSTLPGSSATIRRVAAHRHGLGNSFILASQSLSMQQTFCQLTHGSDQYLTSYEIGIDRPIPKRATSFILT